MVESTSNFAWSLFWRKFTSRVMYFCQIFSASKIFVKLLFIWAGLDVFPFKMMKKEACHRVQRVKISRNWSSSFVGRLCACLKNQTFERQWKMCSTGLNACNLGYGVQRTRISHRCHGKHGEHRKNYTSGTVIEQKEASRASPGWIRDRRNDFSRTPFPPKVPPNGEGQFFPTLPQKMPILFHSGNKRQFKLCSKSVSNYQNQLVEAEKLFKKSHIFAWFHCMAAGRVTDVPCPAWSLILDFFLSSGKVTVPQCANPVFLSARYDWKHIDNASENRQPSTYQTWLSGCNRFTSTKHRAT